MGKGYPIILIICVILYASAQTPQTLYLKDQFLGSTVGYINKFYELAQQTDRQDKKVDWNIMDSELV